MLERRLGRYYHPETNTEWQVVEWRPGHVTKDVDAFRLTRGQLTRSTYTTFAIVYPDGKVIHRSFSGVLPLDLDDLADYWLDHESL